MKAFPSIDPVYKSDIVEMKVSFGMDLRDYFAAKAMQGLVGRSGRKFELSDIEDCYKIADEMMKVRND
jgi:hypothetical protein